MFTTALTWDLKNKVRRQWCETTVSLVNLVVPTALLWILCCADFLSWGDTNISKSRIFFPHFLSIQLVLGRCPHQGKVPCISGLSTGFTVLDSQLLTENALKSTSFAIPDSKPGCYHLGPNNYTVAVCFTSVMELCYNRDLLLRASSVRNKLRCLKWEQLSWQIIASVLQITWVKNLYDKLVSRVFNSCRAGLCQLSMAYIVKDKLFIGVITSPLLQIQ